MSERPSAELVRPLRLQSVMAEHDSVILDGMIEMHAPPVPRIVDVTYNTGKMWAKAKNKPGLRFDIDGTLPDLDGVADFRSIPLPDESVEVVVFDPPHILDMGSAKYVMYGETEKAKVTQDISAHFEPFLLEAKRVLTANGVVFAKLADQVHDHLYRWHQADFVVAARAVGLTPCDLIIKPNNVGSFIDPKWKKAHHTRRAHSYWIVVRKGRCEVRR